MAAHRYWRLYVFARSTNGPVLNEIEMRTVIGGADVTGSGTPNSSDSNSGGAANLFDNNAATNGGTTGGSPYWTGYDFGTPVDIKEFAITTASSAYPSASYGPGFVYVAYSDDGSNFIRISDFVDLSALGDLTTQEINWSVDSIEEPPRLYLGSATHSPGPVGPIKQTLFDILIRYSVENNGLLEISGTVAIDDTPDIPVRRLVRLYRKDSGELVAQQWSAAGTGAYKFSQLANRKYFVLAHDDTFEYNATIKDEILPEAPT